MKKLVLFGLCAMSLFAAENQVRVEGVFMDDKIAHVQANGVRITETVDTKKQNILVEFRTEILQNKTGNVMVFTNNVKTGTQYRNNIPSYASVSLVKEDIISLSILKIGAKFGYKQMFGPNNTNAALTVFEPRARLDMGAITLRAGYEMNNSVQSNKDVKFNAKKVGVDYKITHSVAITAGYEAYRGFLKRNVWVGGMAFQF